MDRRLSGLRTLRDRLERVAESLGEQSAATPDVVLAAVRALHGPDSTVLAEYLDPDQIEAVGAATRAAGPGAHYLLEIEWPQLYRNADALLAAGARPDDPAVQRLVGRLDSLGARFSGGDPEISDRALSTPGPSSRSWSRSRRTARSCTCVRDGEQVGTGDR